MTSSVRRGEPHPFQPVDAPAGPQECGEGAAIPGLSGVGERHPVGVDVLAEQGHLDDAIVDQRAHLGQDVGRTTVDLLAAQRRDDAERAGVVATDGNRHPGRVGRFAGTGQRGRELLQRFGDFHLRDVVVARPFEQGRQRSDVVGAEHDVDPGRLAQHRLAVFLRQATPHRDLHVGIAALARRQVADVAVQLVVGILPDGACVEHHHVGVGALGRPLVTGGLQ